MAEPDRDPIDSVDRPPVSDIAAAADRTVPPGQDGATAVAVPRGAGTEHARAAEPGSTPMRSAREERARHEGDEDGTRTGPPVVESSVVDPSAPRGSGPSPITPTQTVPAPPAEQPLLEPADEDHPAAPRKGGNRLVGTAWVLLAAGLFEVLYFAVLALIVLLLGGPAAVVPQITLLAGTPFAWLPVVFFLLLFELTVLLFNRTGRFAYVVASLVVGFLVYVVSVLLISILVGGGIGDTATLARAFESPEFVLTGLVAREVMLWTGFAIGARGKRVRTRNRAARDAYRQELAERTDAVA